MFIQLVHGVDLWQNSQEPPLKKLAITAPSDEELYTYSTSLRCFGCSSVGEAVHSDDPNVRIFLLLFMR